MRTCFAGKDRDMKKEIKKPIIIIAAVASAFGVLCGAVALILKRNEGTLTPLGWCVERIKEEDAFEDNRCFGFTYSAEEIIYEYPNASDWDETYFVDIAYSDRNGDWYEKWACGISYERTIWRTLKEEQIIEIGCDRLVRHEI